MKRLLILTNVLAIALLVAVLFIPGCAPNEPELPKKPDATIDIERVGDNCKVSTVVYEGRKYILFEQYRGGIFVIEKAIR